MRRTPAEEGRRWIEQAEEDLRWARDLAERGGYHIACFLAQQIGEKALKAFHYSRGDELVVGHSVEQLCERAAERDGAFEEKRGRWSALDGYYVPTRYPNSLPDSIPARVYGEEAARNAVSLAEEIVAFVKERLEPTK